MNNFPLPSLTKSEKDYLNQINSPSLDFKEKTVKIYSEVELKLYYRLIFHAIQTLLQCLEVADNFIYKGILKKNNNEKEFGEPERGGD